jgi:hypothetical protein
MACDLRGVINRYLPGSPVAKPLGWALLGIVGITGVGLTARSLQRPAEPLSVEPAAPSWLATACLVAPYLYYYDECTVLLPLLILWSKRSELNLWQIEALVFITVGYYVAIPVMILRDPGTFTPIANANPDLPEWLQPKPMGWLGGPPWATIAVVALWLLTLTFRGDSKKQA